MTKEKYDKKLKKFFIAKTVCLLVGLISLCVLLFFPIVKTSEKGYSLFDTFKELLKAFTLEGGIMSFSKDDGAGILTAISLFGFPTLFYFVFFLKIIFVIKNLIITIGSINNPAVYDAITDEIALLKKGSPNRRQVKNYRKRRRINGCAIMSYLMPLFFFVVGVMGIVFLDAMSAGGEDLQAYGLATVHNIYYTLLEDINNSMMNLLFLAIGLTFVNFFFSLITFMRKCSTHYWRLDD